MNKRVLNGHIYSVLFWPDLDEKLKQFIFDCVENDKKEDLENDKNYIFNIDDIRRALEGVEDKQLQEAFEELYKASKEHNFIFIEILFNESN